VDLSRYTLQVPPEVTDEEAVLLGDILRCWQSALRGGSCNTAYLNLALYLAS
jgi:hypothetical protein